VTAPVRVWDLPTRLFHWALVALVSFSVVTVKLGGFWMDWHMRSGYAILALVLFRILWGFAGSRYALFSSFVRRPSEVIGYLRGQVEHGAGHSPLAAVSVLVLLAVLLAQATTGLFSNDDIATDGPLARFVTKDTSDAITSLHRLNLWVLAALVAAHVGAVAFHLVALGENLIPPMLSGVKKLPPQHAHAAGGPTPHARALVLLAVAAFAVWWIVKKL
jgi:cytochrome b